MKTIKLCIAIFIIACSCSEEKHSISTYLEPSISSTQDSEEWGKIANPINISFCDDNIRYSKNEIPNIKITNSKLVTGWKGEKLNIQIAIWTKIDLKQVKITTSNLISNNGTTILNKYIKPFFVRYLITDEFAGGCGYRKPIDFDSSIVADILDPIKALDINSNSTRPIWITIDIPRSTYSGIYSGDISIKANNKEYKLALNLEVLKRSIPEPKNWIFHLDLWQNPFAVARYHNVKLWSDKHFEIMYPLFKRLADAGQKCLTTSITHKPWGGQTYDHFESMIIKTKYKNGTWKYDYSIFDKWVTFMMDLGINKQINCYTMIPWGNKLTYFDKSIEKDSTFTATGDSKEFEKYWKPFLIDFSKHLETKNWINITSIAMDERPHKQMEAAIELIKKYAPKLKITSAANYGGNISDNIYDLSVGSSHIPSNEIIEKRKKQNKKLTYYVCCSEAYPNNFTFSPPAEGVWQGWFAANKNLDGFLRWAYNSWVKNPLIDSRFRAWPAGDTYFVYPGNKSSIRFEKLREGIQDFEKIQILRSEFIKKKSLLKLKELENLLTKFELSNFKTIKAKTTVREAQKMLLELSK